MTVDAASMLAAWEVGAAASNLDRAPSLLRSFGWLEAECDPDQMTVGGCDAHLFMLRRALFGETFEASTLCPECGEELEFELSLAELQPDVDAARPTNISIAEDEYQVECRPLRNADLSAAAALETGADIAALLNRCVTSVRAPGGEAIAPRHLPAPVAETVLEAVAASDPGAQVEVTVRCPCGAEWTDELDIRGIVWTELTDWVARTLTDVHTLAQAYGWSEAEILGLSEWRRRWYLAAVS
jgi:hypothetical protein